MKDKQITMAGYKNPVECAKAYLDSVRAEYDMFSYAIVRDIVGELDGDYIENGFVVRYTDDVCKLCDIGNFVIYTNPDNGLLTFCMIDEYDGQDETE